MERVAAKRLQQPMGDEEPYPKPCTADARCSIAPDRRKIGVFYADVSSSSHDLRCLAEFLPEEERDRSNRLVFRHDKNAFIAAHALLRYGLLWITGSIDWQIRNGELGKPELVPVGDGPVPSFNLSHTRGLAAVAVCVGREVGIDAEAVNQDFAFEEIVATHFGPSEQAELAAYDGTTRVEAFFRLWTLKEALLKATGYGLSRPLTDIIVKLEPLSIIVCSNCSERHAWQIRQRKLTGSHWCSLAFQQDSTDVIFVEWHAVSVDTICAALNRVSCNKIRSRCPVL
jgi:4'-phosphopantetheinyl transferase